MLKLTLLISGNLGFNLLKHISKKSSVQIVSVFTDKKSEQIINYATENKILLFTGNPRKQKNKLTVFLKDSCKTDLIFSINYLFIIEKQLIDYPELYALNIHGSLLPKYRGRTPHVWAIINGEKQTGITVHKIDMGIDSGDILLQQKVDINKNDTGNDILIKYNNLYPDLIDKSIRLIEENKAKFIKQDHKKATFFGKRTPANGEINWNWSKERIFNWVRAQAKPYPGSFTFYKGQKLIINKIKYSDLGFNFEMKNGIILDPTELTIKTPNGAIQLVDYRFEGKEIKFEKNTVLGK